MRNNAIVLSKLRSTVGGFTREELFVCLFVHLFTLLFSILILLSLEQRLLSFKRTCT